MLVTYWGTRGSLATPGPETAKYGGNTSCVQIVGESGTTLVLDAGTGLMRLGASLSKSLRRVDILLSHLHMDHIQGLGFFASLYNPAMEVHLWGPASTTMDLRSRLTRYLSPPLFPVRLRDLPCKMQLHQVPTGKVDIGEFTVESWLVCHPGPTVGYRISDGKKTVAYLPDHEPVLGRKTLSTDSSWLSGFSVAEGADLLIHDSQYTDAQYEPRIGWGHSTFSQALQFASLAGVKSLAPFHHDPSHDDATLTRLLDEAIGSYKPRYEVCPAMETGTVKL